MQNQMHVHDAGTKSIPSGQCSICAIGSVVLAHANSQSISCSAAVQACCCTAQQHMIERVPCVTQVTCNLVKHIHRFISMPTCTPDASLLAARSLAQPPGSHTATETRAQSAQGDCRAPFCARWPAHPGGWPGCAGGPLAACSRPGCLTPRSGSPAACGSGPQAPVHAHHAMSSEARHRWLSTLSCPMAKPPYEFAEHATPASMRQCCGCLTAIMRCSHFQIMTLWAWMSPQLVGRGRDWTPVLGTGAASAAGGTACGSAPRARAQRRPSARPSSSASSPASLPACPAAAAPP